MKRSSNRLRSRNLAAELPQKQAFLPETELYLVEFGALISEKKSNPSLELLYIMGTYKEEILPHKLVKENTIKINEAKA